MRPFALSVQILTMNSIGEIHYETFSGFPGGGMKHMKKYVKIQTIKKIFPFQ